eukprot:CAMPEP_0180443292 /NCGR_PEP_ID=MMETSP1036_2-20121128/14593_1 /TAXON_ID=632150 /ORGANISM="Azadinium spinosum, Strain 3D9" /LENGTH=95 /DNA_ID=CAMNT_0022449587 /DNA_START=394 /DNA_END=678 /DNA_ORIENTATION=-
MYRHLGLHGARGQHGTHGWSGIQSVTRLRRGHGKVELPAFGSLAQISVDCTLDHKEYLGNELPFLPYDVALGTLAPSMCLCELCEEGGLSAFEER